MSAAPQMEKADWVIRKRGYFYRPNRAGYTANIAEAGRYTEEEAAEVARGRKGEVSVHLASEFAASPALGTGGVTRLLDLIDELAGAEDAVAEDVGTGARTPLVILRELVATSEQMRALTAPPAPARGEGQGDDILVHLDSAWNEEYKTNLMHYCDLAAQEIRKLRALASAPASPTKQGGDMERRARQIIECEEKLAASDPPGDIQTHALRVLRVGTARQILGEMDFTVITRAPHGSGGEDAALTAGDSR